jgi:hypothetical protein
MTYDAFDGCTFLNWAEDTSTGVLARNLVSTQFWSVRCSTRANDGGGTNPRTGVL